MRITCLFGLRNCSYPGEYAPELLDAIDEIWDSDNPDFLNDKEYEYLNSGEFTILKRIDVNLPDKDFDRIFYDENTIDGSVVKLENIDVSKLYIGIEYDDQLGWIVTLPKVYAEGIEQETESTHEFFKDAKEEADMISKKTGFPIKAYDKQGKEVIE